MELSRRYNWPLFYCLITVVKAYTVFETTCPIPAAPASFVSSPNTRGTLDILWSSVFTVIACTWTLQHPNIPEQRNGRDPGQLGDVKWRLRGSYNSVMRMLWAVIAPEIIISAACGDLIEASHSNRELQEYAAQDGVKWTLAHSYYANMGGFIIRSKPTRINAYHDPYHLNAYGMYALRRRNYLQKLPDIATEELDDRSKSDGFVKVIAVGQIAWTILQILVRTARNLTNSPLEIAVVAFAVCAVIIYGLYWKKPQRICATETILQYPQDIPGEVLQALQEKHADDRFLAELFLVRKHVPLPGSRISIASSKRIGSKALLVVSTGTVGAAIFGGIHAAAWNFAFPSTAEKVLWRCASIYSAVSPFYCLLHFAVASGAKSRRKSTDLLSILILPLLGGLYVAARLFVLIEVVRTLCFLPPDAFVATWTSNIPHIV
ncbi:hypothetical protein TARUN_2672 [Trichoderma arundinaceum]|uniref:Uncharacterized protein n=1 Tax=Trichoderma arundinaceum TaxID=490622 RepID=A0A395NUC5_TRIAR|nr:hypothetical protein TARUN_2672 [Trichoderma arundinaceum]